MVIKNADSDDKWTFGLNLCEYLLYAFSLPYEIEPCPRYIYHFVLSVHPYQLSLFQKRILQIYGKYLSNTSQQIRLKAHLIFLDPHVSNTILVKHQPQSVWCLSWDPHMKWSSLNKYIILLNPSNKHFVYNQSMNTILFFLLQDFNFAPLSFKSVAFFVICLPDEAAVPRQNICFSFSLFESI